MGQPALSYASVDTLGRSMAAGELSSVALTEQLIARIEALDTGPDGLHSVLEVNPAAVEEAAAADSGRRAGSARPLLGIPVLVKDNIDTVAPMHTTAGSLALAHASPPRDAAVVTALRRAGAVVLGKTNLSEWANYRSTSSTSGWSAVGGLTRNPYDPTRSAGGSSSGSGAATAAGFAPLTIGTETDGSITCPAALNGVVGIKPTVGLLSRTGIVPISASQDTPGPMARTVRDAALLLTALTDLDPSDSAGRRPGRPAGLDYTRFCGPGRLDGVRIGLPRGEGITGYHAGLDAAVVRALGVLADLGAELVEGVSLPDLEALSTNEQIVLDHELAVGLEQYLRERGADVSTLAEVIAFNEANAEAELAWFGQEHFVRAAATSGLRSAEYLVARAAAARAGGADGIDAALQRHDLHLLALPAFAPAWTNDLVNGDHVTGGCSTYAAVAGYPLISVPCGTVAGPHGPLPVGLALSAGAWSEPVLLRVASAYEAAAGEVCPPPPL